MKIHVLGTGCAKCKTLTANAEEAVRQAGIEAEVVKVSDLQEIMKFGVMMTPALAVNGEVKSVGKLLSPDEIVKILKP